MGEGCLGGMGGEDQAVSVVLPRTMDWHGLRRTDAAVSVDDILWVAVEV